MRKGKRKGRREKTRDGGAESSPAHKQKRRKKEERDGVKGVREERKIEGRGSVP